MPNVTPKRYYTFMLEPELLEALKAAKDQDPERSEAGIIRQALREWFKKHGVTVKSPNRRAGTRRKG
jgi:hypothetical protein